MRLTLRTLLAYLDDILEPSETREIGEKLHESTFATSLVEKIQDVVRRRRIGAPAVSGPGAEPDPNSVAEYLDNTLPPESVADLERICLESDVHLAEVAACHQVLTLVLGESVDIPAPLREHMYALGAIAASNDVMHVDGPVKHTPKVAGVGAADALRKPRPLTGDMELTSRATMPSGRRWEWKQIAPAIVGGLILTAWGYFTFTGGPWNEHSVAHQEPNVSEINLDDDARAGREAPSGVQEPRTREAEQSATDSDDSSVANGPIDVELEEDAQISRVPPPPVDVTPPPIPIADASTPAVPVGSTASSETIPSVVGAVATTTPADLVPDPQAFDPAPPAAQTPPALEPFQVQYTSTEGVLLHHDGTTDQWSVMPRRSLIFPGEEIAAPEPFDARFVVSDDKPACEVVLRGGTRVRSLDATAESRFGLEIDQGRVLLSSRAAADGAVLVVRLKVREDEWLCEIMESSTALAIEIDSIGPQGVGDLSGRTEYGGGIQILSGAARLTNVGNQRVLELQPERALLAFSSDPQAAPAEPAAALTVPDWALPNASTGSLARHFAAKYEKEFLADQPVSASIRPVVKDRQPRMSELATQTLALTESVPGLIDALSAAHEESRIAAIEGLRRWLSRDEQHAGPLQAELQSQFREDVAAAITRMLWGYQPQDARHKFASQELVDWMAHDEIAVRELAAYHVARLTGRSYGYRADRRAEERDAIVKRWRKDLEKSGALISDAPASREGNEAGAKSETPPAAE